VIVLKSAREIALMRRAGHILAGVVERSRLRPPGMSRSTSTRTSRRTSTARAAAPAFKGYRGFRRRSGVSINEEVVHGIRRPRRKIHEGDIVGLDLGASSRGTTRLLAFTLPVARAGDVQKLLMSRAKALDRPSQGVPARAAAVGTCRTPSSRTSRRHGFLDRRAFVGHGIGRALPKSQIPTSGIGQGARSSVPGGAGDRTDGHDGELEVRILDDGWTAVTQDGSLAAHSSTPWR